MRKLILVAVVLVGLLALAGCAPGPNPSAEGPDAAGFWQGLWNGFTVLFTFVISLFNPKVTVYEVNNSGGWYDFGYLLGVMTFWGGGGRGAAAGSKR